MDSKRALAENLRKNIYDLNMTQAKYAKEIGIPITTLEYVISGKGSVSLNTLDKIAMELELIHGSLFGLLKANKKSAPRRHA